MSFNQYRSRTPSDAYSSRSAYQAAKRGTPDRLHPALRPTRGKTEERALQPDGPAPLTASTRLYISPASIKRKDSAASHRGPPVGPRAVYAEEVFDDRLESALRRTRRSRSASAAHGGGVDIASIKSQEEWLHLEPVLPRLPVYAVQAFEHPDLVPSPLQVRPQMALMDQDSRVGGHCFQTTEFDTANASQVPVDAADPFLPSYATPAQDQEQQKHRTAEIPRAHQRRRPATSTKPHLKYVSPKWSEIFVSDLFEDPRPRPVQMQPADRQNPRFSESTLDLYAKVSAGPYARQMAFCETNPLPPASASRPGMETEHWREDPRARSAGIRVSHGERSLASQEGRQKGRRRGSISERARAIVKSFVGSFKHH